LAWDQLNVHVAAVFREDAPPKRWAGCYCKDCGQQIEVAVAETPGQAMREAVRKVFQEHDRYDAGRDAVRLVPCLSPKKP
jgi:hypothetical protein